ncbi:peptidase [Streptacidiphilus carbonis]|uniref:peptidase n=1 Tax=Streptacidiphilus carbonis TaxID=105422 RepID=UPI001F16ACB3|nr:peptidase [Streptacidiphilus carbonis]
MLAVAGAGVLAGPVGAVQAAGAAVAVPYHCETPLGPKDAVSEVAVTAVPSGGGYAVTMDFTNGVSSSPVDLGPDAMRPSAVLDLGGADSGTVKVAGPGNARTVPAGTPVTVGSMTGSYRPGRNARSGTVTFTPGVLTVLSYTLTTTCTPTGTRAVGLSLPITVAGSTSGSSAAGSGSMPAAAPDALAETGSGSDPVSLGLFGGTVLLGGLGGVLFLTRRGRMP